MVMNVIDAVSGLVLAQLPVENKDCEITAIPELLKLLDIRTSTMSIDAIGTQTVIMEQIIEQGGHFVLMVKKNQPQSYEEIIKYFEEMSEDHKKMKENPHFKPRYPEMMKKYEEKSCQEKNRDRYENRCYKVCGDVSFLTKAQKEWSYIKTVGHVRQIRIPLERDEWGNDITPDVGMISDRELSAIEMGAIKRAHWSIENKLHHVLDDSFREERSPAKKSKNNL